MSARKNTCSYCGERGPLTKDHIVPKRTGAPLRYADGTRNFRWCCLRCNNLREHARDCPAVAIMATQVAREARMKPRQVLAAWGYIGGFMKRTHATAKLLAARAEA